MDYTLDTFDDVLDKNCSTVRNNFYMVMVMSIDIYIGYPDTSDSLSLNQPLPFRPFSITLEISPLTTTGLLTAAGGSEVTFQNQEKHLTSL